MKKFCIVACSSGNLKSTDIVSKDIEFKTVPLTITLSGKDWVDSEDMDINAFIAAMKANKDKPLTACPSPEAFAQAFETADSNNIICATITGKLSGTYNAAVLAKEQLKEKGSNKNIYILDTKSATAGQQCMIHKIISFIEDGNYDFNKVVEKSEEIVANTKTRFLVQDLSNLRKTGRLSLVKSLIANALRIKLVCGAENGEIKEYAKALSAKKAFAIIADMAKEDFASKGKDSLVVIAHVNNEEDALYFKTLIETIGYTNIKVNGMRGLSTFYASDKGVVIGF